VKMHFFLGLIKKKSVRKGRIMEQEIIQYSTYKHFIQQELQGCAMLKSQMLQLQKLSEKFEGKI
jgi:hypothetical protein